MRLAPYLAMSLAAGLIAGCAETGFLAQLGKSIGGDEQGEGGGSFVVGDPYRVGEVWYAPHEDYAYDETGLAAIVRPGRGERTANGEKAEATKLLAQHPTLQLPAIARVTNLENGRAVLVRVNDRGPREPGRLIGLTPRAGQLLGIAGNGPARVRVQVVGPESRAVAAEARARTPAAAGAGVAVASPRAPVTAEALEPPPGASATPMPSASMSSAPMSPAAQRASLPAGPAPAAAGRHTARQGTLWVQAGAYGSTRRAERTRARLTRVGPTSVTPTTAHGRTLWRVRVGPAHSAAEAERLLAATVKAGAADARIVAD